ncbi:hypothetical protein [Pedobacter heparinus]|uniref:hypothetical protein n=1 Tax=Pedobacter heparinus TaxID=984 RepID=UPI00292D7209|nr:hypothetical protein [Pedobacter heparinus]
MEHKNDRRDFIKKISVASLGLVLADGFTNTYASPAGQTLTDVRSTLLGNLSQNPSEAEIDQRIVKVRECKKNVGYLMF